MCTLLVTQNVAWLFSGGELVLILIYTCLVTQTVAHLVSEGELTRFLMCTLLVTDYGLACFRR